VKEESARIAVRVQPNASQSKVMRSKDEVWHIKVAAPAVKGKANQELIKFLSNILGVSKSHLTVERGMTSKEKVIVINGLTQNQVMRQLAQQEEGKHVSKSH
jgi:uncharacterized protein (TIGR00251 family)